ncbi:E3 ubiquitin-protein ligase DDB_G0292642-like isoform X1 [Ambystoma mexicanum]|uniref:E3 ubiquitin-protein ligase DDB_G0292642-like isoform X1 n=1 Tax=Ambystoma mexicanum TaxID=8296 RepID=UPI0037E8B8E9
MAVPGCKSVTFVQGKDEITGDDETDLRVLLSCGHTADPDSVMKWCKTLLAQGKTRFHCPVPIGNKSCDKEWSYEEIRKIALHNQEERKEFEETMASSTAKQCCEYKQCPGCKTLVERKDRGNLNVRCIICTARNGKAYDFCWQCLKPWTGEGLSSTRCRNEGCRDGRLDMLQNCKLNDLPDSEIKGCPAIRACPTCGILIEHKENCKYVTCRQCGKTFCFACLQAQSVCLKEKAVSYFETCARPVAPRQTILPVWSQQKSQTHLGTESDAGDDLEDIGVQLREFLALLNGDPTLQQLNAMLEQLQSGRPPQPPTTATPPTPPPPTAVQSGRPPPPTPEKKSGCIVS